MPLAGDRRRANAATRIARAFRAHLARRPTNTTTLNAVPARRRLQLGTQAHDASSIAELMRRNNWRDPLTRTPLTNAQAAAAWNMHIRNEAAEARRAGRQYAAPPMPHRPAGATGLGSARQGEIWQWYHSGGGGGGQHQVMPPAPRASQVAAKSALMRGWKAVLRSGPRWMEEGGEWTGRDYNLRINQNNPVRVEWKFSGPSGLIALITLSDSVNHLTIVRSSNPSWAAWARDMSDALSIKTFIRVRYGAHVV